MSNEQIKSLQDSITSYRKDAELADSLNRLKGNRDFRKLVLEGYFKDEAVRLVHLKADPAMATPDRQASVVREIDAIGSFRGYLDLVARQGEMARAAIEHAENEIVLIEQEAE